MILSKFANYSDPLGSSQLSRHSVHARTYFPSTCSACNMGAEDMKFYSQLNQLYFLTLLNSNLTQRAHISQFKILHKANSSVFSSQEVHKVKIKRLFILRRFPAAHFISASCNINSRTLCGFILEFSLKLIFHVRYGVGSPIIAKYWIWVKDAQLDALCRKRPHYPHTSLNRKHCLQMGN